MCEPLTLASLAIGAAGTAANAIGQRNQQKKQEQEVERFNKRQEQLREAEAQRQEQWRVKASEAQQQGVEDLSLKNQDRLQDAEEARLKTQLSGEGTVNPTDATPVSSADIALARQDEAGGDVFKTDLARQIADATASAKQRIGALATVSSFGGSSGGLGTVNPMIQQAAGQDIDLNNEKRQGSLGVFGKEVGGQPAQYDAYSNPIADIASSFLSVGMQGLGKGAAGNSTGVSSIFNNAIKTPVPTPTPVVSQLPMGPYTARF